MTATSPAYPPPGAQLRLVESEVTTAAATPPVLDVVIPVHNEQTDLQRCVVRLRRYLDNELPVSARITIADNASTDLTWQIAERLAVDLPGVRAIRLTEKGRGRALQAAWGDSDATILAYMDVDLSTDLAALHPLVAPLLSGHSDVAIGTRLTHGARVVRGPKRELISRAYNTVLHATLRTRFSDAQCGFKALRRDRAQLLLPLVQDNEWFFDTELLVLAERAGLRIHEVPVDWTDDPDSRVDIPRTAIADLRGVARLGRGLAAGTIPLDALAASVDRHPVPTGLARQAARFAAIGLASTVAYLALYVALRTGMSSFAANFLALLVTAIANTAANRRLTFGITGGAGAFRHQVQGLGVFVLALATTTMSLAILQVLDRSPARAVEASVLVAANLVATVMRFVLLRGWVFRGPTATSQQTHRE
jgi:putative flippase GtrA